MTLTVVYDNNPYDPACKTAWGFACLIETAQATVLFDTGGDGPTLLGNMDELGIDPASIDLIALSHIHGDHTGGLIPLLDTGIHPVVYAPAAFSTFFKSDVRARTELVEVTDPMRLAPSIHTTGEVGTRIVEQALIVETSRGAIVITGCAHPGIVNMVQRAHKTVPGEIDLVMGGFHLGNASRKQIDQIIHELEVLGVHRAAPSHCTGERAREMFAHAFGESFVPIGAGAKITVEP